MRRLLTPWRRRAERGSIAIEAAFSLLMLFTFVVLPFLFARIFWYYGVAQKAAHDGARFLANVAQVEIVTAAGNGGAALPVAAVARAIVDAEIADIRPVLDDYSITVLCDFASCGIGVPQFVNVIVQFRLRNDMFREILGNFFSEDPLILEARVTMRYVGS